MNNKELRKLNRRQLLELMLEQSKRIDELEKQLEAANQKLADRRIAAAEAGNIAEAALRLNGIFAAAQEAAEQYLLSVQAMAQQKHDEQNFHDDQTMTQPDDFDAIDWHTDFNDIVLDTELN